MNFDRPPKSSEQVESEKIIENLALKVGKKIKIVNRIASYASRLEVGKEIDGILKNDVKIGFPIEFDGNANTSNVKNIKEENGKYLIQTLTSTYEIINNALENIEKKITNFESFTTKRGSIYRVLENGQVQRSKTILDNPTYEGEDKGQNKEREPSDIMLFIDPKTNIASWFNGVSASRGDFTVAQQISIGVYKPDGTGNYSLVTNNIDLDDSSIFVWVNDKKDSFKLEKNLTLEELKGFEKRIKDDRDKKFGFINSINTGDIITIPKLGYDTFDYRYGNNGKVESVHNGSKVASIKEWKLDNKIQNQTNEDWSNWQIDSVNVNEDKEISKGSEKNISEEDLQIKNQVPENPETKNENILSTMEESALADFSNSFSLLLNEFSERDSNGNTKFFYDETLNSLGNVAVKFKNVNDLENLDEDLKYLLSVLFELSGNNKNVHADEINDNDESLNQLTSRIRNFFEKLEDFADVLNQNDNKSDTRSEIVKNLHFSSDIAEQIRIKIGTYR
jgi:hypothetical protein